MEERKYNKLVRDRVPEIIKGNGEEPVTYILGDIEYKKALDDKLLEEVNEYLKEDNLEEIADIYEVICAILEYKGISFEDMQSIAIDKKNNRGGFYSRIFLKDVIAKV